MFIQRLHSLREWTEEGVDPYGSIFEVEQRQEWLPQESDLLPCQTD
ncbi:unnamed protein product [Linum tenue]|uniref:Uncharacterized protein n=1 Tax=Linum tenue TaxID=586396 RepID=A0AAV0J3A9_9ROSI|nr:unnamed protein product [Linum tenue]